MSKISILNRYTGAVIMEVEGDTLRGANLTWANLTEANLTWANLTGANLTRADLTEANLTGADLTRADLTGADLAEANLTRAEGLTATGDILRIAGTRHPIWCIDAGNLSIGCKRNTLAWWRDNAAEVGKAEGYSDAQIAEYQRHIEYCAEWLAAVKPGGGDE